MARSRSRRPGRTSGRTRSTTSARAASSSPRTARARSASPASRRRSAGARTSSSSTSARAPAGRVSRRRCCASARGTRSEQGAKFVSLDVLTTNEQARVVWSRLGFEEHAKFMATPARCVRGAARERGRRRVAGGHARAERRRGVRRARRLAVHPAARSARGADDRQLDPRSPTRSSTAIVRRTGVSRASCPTGSAP